MNVKNLNESSDKIIHFYIKYAYILFEVNFVQRNPIFLLVLKRRHGLNNCNQVLKS